MRLIISTVVRDAPLESHGYVYIVDWDRKEIIRRFQPPLPRTQHNVPRGGSRGYRGITFGQDRCYIANHDSIFAYDEDWNLVDTISHPLFASIHDIEFDGEFIWITSTEIDAVFKIDLAGNILEDYFLGELPAEDRAQLGISSRIVDRTLDHRDAMPDTASHIAHPNGVSVVNGRPYVTLYRPGAVICLNPFQVVWRNDDYYGSHSGRVFDNGRSFLVAASFQSMFLQIDLASGQQNSQISALVRQKKSSGILRTLIQKAAHLPIFGRLPTVFILKHAPSALRGLLPTSRPGWTRGIAVIDDEHFFGGSSSATISLVNAKEERIEDQMQLEKSIEHSIFSIAIDPRVE